MPITDVFHLVNNVCRVYDNILLTVENCKLERRNFWIMGLPQDEAEN